jgi:protein gp37
MPRKSTIEWTDGTWNPSTGCTKISEGCKFCYAEALAKKLQKIPIEKYRDGFKFTIHPRDLELPLRWTKPQMIFVNSMSDLFHEDMPSWFLFRIFHVMKYADQHIYQILTKRPERMLAFVQEYVRHEGPIPDYVWMGVTVENLKAIPRIYTLRRLPCSVRFISAEPLLESLGPLDLSGIDWVIVGGESGPYHRPMNPEWVREIRDQCQAQGVPFFFKQFGGLRPKSGGKELDGRTWLEYPRGAVDRLHRLRGQTSLQSLDSGALPRSLSELPDSSS